MPDDHATDDERCTKARRSATDEADADFLADLPPEAHPSVLKLTATSERVHRRDALDRLERWEAGEEVPRVVNFEHPSDLRSLLTERRIELLEQIVADPPDSIRKLAEWVDRDVKSVHDDLQVLVEYEIVHFERNGRAKRPFVPYDRIEVALEITGSDAIDDTVSV